jgi:hypothetical protein
LKFNMPNLLLPKPTASDPSYYGLLDAGYDPQRIYVCPLNDARGHCPCNYAASTRPIDVLPEGCGLSDLNAIARHRYPTPDP